MASEFTFPPYEEKVTPLIEKFGIEKMETYDGDDIRPLWNMTGGALTSSFKYLYAAPKLEKIVLGVQSYRDKLKTYTLSIWPDVSISDALEKRATVDAAIMRLSDIILNSARRSPSCRSHVETAGNHAMHPCEESHPPCMLVIPVKELICPFPQPDG